MAHTIDYTSIVHNTMCICITDCFHDTLSYLVPIYVLCIASSKCHSMTMIILSWANSSLTLSMSHGTSVTASSPTSYPCALQEHIIMNKLIIYSINQPKIKDWCLALSSLLLQHLVVKNNHF